MVLLLLACGNPTPTADPVPTSDPTPDPWAATIVEPTPTVPVVEALGIDGDSATADGGVGAFVDAGGQASWLDPWLRVEGLQASLGDLRAAAPWEGGVLLATDAGYHLWDGGLQAVGLEATAGVADRLLPTDDGLWLSGANGVFLHRDTVTSALTANGEPARDIALGLRGGERVVWTASGLHVLAAQPGVDGLEVVEATPLFDPVDAIASDDAGQVFALVRGWLVQRTPSGTWRRLDPGEPVRELYGTGSAPAVWARTDEAWLVHQDDGWHRLTVDAETTGSVDAAGRMLFLDDGALIRVGVERPVVLIDLPEDAVILPARVGIAPTQTGGLGSITARLVDESGATTSLTVDDTHGEISVLLEPDLLPSGLYTLEVEASYPEGVSSTSAAVLLGTFAPTWDGYVRNLFDQRCATNCHEGPIQPNLDTPEAWQTEFDRILANVAADPPVMPPNAADALTPLEVQLLETWRDEGFPR